MNKRDLMLSLLDAGQEPEVVPAAFFLHFDPQYHRGRPAVEKHLEYFRATDMDFVKIQFEQRFPRLPQIQKPEDWDRMPFYGLDFYADQLEVVAGLVQAARREALVILTLYSPFMLAGQMIGEAELTHQILTNPVAVRRGMQVITDSLLGFVRECIRLGLDGFYTSTQGGESGRFPDRSAFDECVRPFDLVCMEEAQRSCVFNILHVCDFRLPYSDLSPYVDYPGHVVSAGLELTTGKTSAREVARLFGRPFMGGLDRQGVLATGTEDEVRGAAEAALAVAPEQFVLGADCTVPSETSWANLRTAIEAAHHFHQYPAG